METLQPGGHMEADEHKTELEYSPKDHPEAEYPLERLLGYLLIGIGVFLIFLKVTNHY